MQYRCAGRAFQLPDPYPYPMMLTRARIRPVPKIATRPDSTRGYTRTRSLPVGLPLLAIIGLVAYPRPRPLHCIIEFIFCCEYVLHASSSLCSTSALEALCDYALYNSTFTLHYITLPHPMSYTGSVFLNVIYHLISNQDILVKS